LLEILPKAVGTHTLHLYAQDSGAVVGKPIQLTCTPGPACAHRSCAAWESPTIGGKAEGAAIAAGGSFAVVTELHDEMGNVTDVPGTAQQVKSPKLPRSTSIPLFSGNYRNRPA
jgi:hypothetical protein